MAKLLRDIILEAKASRPTEVVAPHPIHFRYPYGLQEAVSPHPIHFRNPYGDISEASSMKTLQPSDNELDEISKKLKSTRPRLTTSQRYDLNDYTDDHATSYMHNSDLIDAHNSGTDPEANEVFDKKFHRSLTRITSKPLGHKVDLYSGVGFDPKKLMKDSASNILHLPAFTSTTHSPAIALHHAVRTRPRGSHVKPGDTAHIIKVTTTPETKGFHIGEMSEFESERETLLPSGTKLKYSHTTDHRDEDNPALKIKMHHFTVHSQP